MQALRALARLQSSAPQLRNVKQIVEVVSARPVRTFWSCSPRWARVPVRRAEVVAVSHPLSHGNFLSPMGPLGRTLLEEIQADMKALRSEFWSDFQAVTHSKDRVFRLPAEVSETKSSYKVITDVPGIEREHVRVKVSSEGVLEITAKRAEAAEAAEEGVQKQHQEYTLKRVFSLPAEVDREGIQAHLKNGRLEVVLPKVPTPAPVQKEVEIAMG